MKQRKQKTDRDSKARQEARKKLDENNPMFKFMNERDENGMPKYTVAKKIWDYILANPEASMNGMRMANSLVHELRYHKIRAAQYLDQSRSDDPVTLRNEHGTILTKEECYINYIKEVQVGHLAIEKLRSHLYHGLLATVDGQVFTAEMYNEFVLKVESIVNELGYDLFPTKVEILEPL